jgi:hypothetical protein
MKNNGKVRTNGVIWQIEKSVPFHKAHKINNILRNVSVYKWKKNNLKHGGDILL